MGNDHFFRVTRSALPRVSNRLFGIWNLPYLNLGIRDLPYLTAGIRNFKAKWTGDMHGMLVSLTAVLVSSPHAPSVGKIFCQVKP